MKRTQLVRYVLGSLVIFAALTRAQIQQGNPPAGPRWIGVSLPVTSEAARSRLSMEREDLSPEAIRPPLQTVYDRLTGAVLVTHPMQAYVATPDGICGLTVSGGQLQLFLSHTNTPDPANYSEARDNLARGILATPGVAAQPSVAIALDRIFGVDVVFPFGDARGWNCVAPIERAQADGRSLRVEMRSVAGNQLRVEFDQNRSPVAAFVKDREILIVDRGGGRLGSTSVAWFAPRPQTVVTEKGTRQILSRLATVGSASLVMSVDPETGLVLHYWDTRPGFWVGRAFLVGSHLFRVGVNGRDGQVYLVRSQNRVTLGRDTAEALEVIEKSLVSQAEARALSSCQIDVAKLLGPERCGSLSLDSVAVRELKATVTFLVETTDGRPGQASIELDESSQLTAAFYVDRNQQIRSPTYAGEQLSVPKGIVRPADFIDFDAMRSRDPVAPRVGDFSE